MTGCHILRLNAPATMPPKRKRRKRHVEFHLPVPTLIVAFLALWIAYQNYRRNNFALLRVKDCSCSHPVTIGENGGQYFHQFTIRVQNLGIPLHNVAMALVFWELNGAGTLSYPLQKKAPTKDGNDQLAKGMVAEFFWKSYRLSPDDTKFLLSLENPSKQGARLCVYSDSYLAWELKIAICWDTFKTEWNWLAFRINSKLHREIGKNHQGLPIIKYYEIIPTFGALRTPVMRFIDALRRDHSKSQSSLS